MRRRTLAALAATALLPLMTTTTAAADGGTPAHVTWDGWKAAKLGVNIHRAAKQLGKPLRTSCKPLYTIEHTARGLYISNLATMGKDIDTIAVGDGVSKSGFETASTVRGPVGIRVGMHFAGLKARLAKHDLTLHNRFNTEAQRKGDYWVKGTDGHILWFRLDRYEETADGDYVEHKDEVAQYNLNATKSDAFTVMKYQGGC